MQTPSSISSVVRPTTTLVVLLLCIATTTTTTTTTAQTTTPEFCRCTAKFEHFYDRRNLFSLKPQEGRTLLFENYAYDYTDYYVDDDGYYVIEGVRVLPDDDPACSDDDDDAYLDTDSVNDVVANDEVPAHQKRTGIFAHVFGAGRTLYGVESEDEYEANIENDESESQQRTLMGMMGGMMSSSGKYDYYYNDDGGYGKGKVSVFLMDVN
jgi:hypothetical protein